MNVVDVLFLVTLSLGGDGGGSGKGEGRGPETGGSWGSDLRVPGTPFRLKTLLDTSERKVTVSTVEETWAKGRTFTSIVM